MNKKIWALCLSGMVMAACTVKKEKPPVAGPATSEMYMLVGSYATPEEEGVKVYRFNEETGDASYVSGLKGVSNPSYITPSADGRKVYAVGEDEGSTATANTLSFNKKDGQLSLLGSQPAQGGAPCYITLSPSGKFVVTANYMGGNITVFALNKEGLLKPEPRLISFAGVGADKERQLQPHLHCVAFTPDHKYMLANDLGTDKIYMFPLNKEIAGEAAHTLLDEGKMSEVALEPGSGPRHVCFHPNRKFAYLINELSGKVAAFSYHDGRLDLLQYIEADSVGARGSADIHVSPDGRYVYASNRLKADGIAIFSVDAETGLLTKVGYQPTGIHPRNFAITPNGSYLLVACRDDNMIQVFKVDKATGLLSDTGKTIKASKPVCLKFVAY